MKTYAITYVTTLLVFVLVDAIWLTLVMRGLFVTHLGPLLAEPVRYVPAVVFYLIFTTGLLVLAIEPAVRAGSLRSAIILGMVLGLTAYATYDLTNRATLQAWPMVIVIVDIAWGTILSAIAAAAGYSTLRMMRGETI